MILIWCSYYISAIKQAVNQSELESLESSGTLHKVLNILHLLHGISQLAVITLQ